MKKSLFVLFLLVFGLTGLVAESYVLDAPTPDCKASYYKKGGYWLLQGFDFENYDPDTDPDLRTVVDNEIKKIKSYPEYSKDYVVVGHSQGGPRALAYATRLKQTQTAAEYNKLLASITVSGVDKGIKALDGGFGGLKSKITTDVDIFFKGITGTLSTLDVFGLKNLIFGYGIDPASYIVAMICSANDTSVSGFFLDLAINIFGLYGKYSDKAIGAAKYFPRGWNNRPYDEIKQLYDMMPKSSFISNYVAGTTNKTCKYKSGTKTELYWASKKVGFLTIKYLSTRTVPVYTTYTYAVDVAKFDKDLPVGYIVGLDSKTFTLTDTLKDDGTYDHSSSKKLYKTCDVLGTVFNVGKGVNIAESVLCYATLNIVSGTSHAVDATKCSKAADLCNNIDSYLNDIKGSSENDGLVAKESQYIPMKATDKNGVVTEIHSKVLGDHTNGYVSYPQYNHKFTEPVIYGSPKRREPISDSPDQTVNKKVMSMIEEARLMKSK